MRSSSWPLMVLALVARAMSAQAVDPAQRLPSTTVSGVVRDSLSGFPLAGAVVQLAATDSGNAFSASSTSDSLGRYQLRDVPAGRYLLGFLHAVLDSLGVEPSLHAVQVDGTHAMHVDLATPSTRTLRATICASEDAGLLIGFVRLANDRAPAANASVVGEWLEITLKKREFIRKVPRLVARTGENGWFAMCNVPLNGWMTVAAILGADSTDVVELQVPSTGFIRREFYIGPGRTGRLSGSVTAINGQPLPGASVRVAGGPATRANDRGEWTIAEMPVGTRTIEIRAVGFYPERRAVDVLPGVTAEPIRTQLMTLQSVLDTVHVTASRLGNLDRAEFMTRKRTTAGTFLTGDDVQKRGGQVVTDVFKTISGMRIGFASDTAISELMDVQIDPYRSPDHRILMRGLNADWCAPIVFVNGLHLRDLSSEELDVLVRVKTVTGIEIYREAATPAQFQVIQRGCGTILIWTKER